MTSRPKHLWITFAALLGLAGLSLWLGTGSLDPPWGLVVSLTIAAAKVVLIAVVFMDLGEHGGGARLTAIATPVFVVILVSLMLGDVWLR